jgi:phage terminase Nu1 subunit (DNA packaging protein)
MDLAGSARSGTGLAAVPDDLVTRHELAEMMRVSIRTVDQLKREGMPCVTWGRRLVRFRANEAMRWAEAHADRKAA